MSSEEIVVIRDAKLKSSNNVDISELSVLLNNILARINGRHNTGYYVEMINDLDDLIDESPFEDDEDLQEECEHAFAVTESPYRTNDIVDISKSKVPDDCLLVCIRCGVNYDLIKSKEEASKDSFPLRTGGE